MKPFHVTKLMPRIQILKWLSLGLVLTWMVGCQSVIKSKKGKDAFSDGKFSCGDPMPNRIP